ncbi:MAG: hypothetical protein RQ748_09015, partial [Elusimicrobiales bacterium]|nr:hypothetical protein [Elusimicrobiales bacterium]
YNLYQVAHNWYAKEVRIVRNGTGVRSWESAQGFRIDKRKLHVADADAEDPRGDRDRKQDDPELDPAQNRPREALAFETLGDGPTRPCRARRIEEPALPPRVPPVRFRKTVPTSWVELAITEGRNRQVRRMLAHVGFPVLRLVRRAVGAVTLEGLEPGRWRELTQEEVRSFSK